MNKTMEYLKNNMGIVYGTRNGDELNFDFGKYNYESHFVVQKHNDEYLAYATDRDDREFIYASDIMEICLMAATFYSGSLENYNYVEVTGDVPPIYRNELVDNAVCIVEEAGETYIGVCINGVFLECERVISADDVNRLATYLVQKVKRFNAMYDNLVLNGVLREELRYQMLKIFMTGYCRKDEMLNFSPLTKK